jgi:uncharacterized membrane protein YoaK (UPF0700 family)
MSDRRSRIAPAVIVATFIVTRLLYQTVSTGVGTISVRGNLAQRVAATLRGETFDVSTLGSCMPIIDRELLLNDLGRSLWYLHAQPPLFNLFVAGMLRLPGNFARNYQYANWLMALALYLIAFALMRRFRVRSGIATLATILLMLNPNAMWCENAVYYGVPLALLIVASAFALANALQRGSIAWLAATAMLLVILPLTRAFFTSIWCALALVLIGYAFAKLHPEKRRKAIAAAALPFALVIAFQIKQYVVFKQTLGSSWFGCNLAAMTAGMTADKAQALAEHRVSPLVLVYRNDPPESYMPYVDVAPTGVPLLDRTRKSTGEPNFHHAIYIPVGRQYLRDTLWLIAHHPLKYLANVANSTYILSGYQLGVYFDHPQKFFARWSWLDVAAPLIGFPLIVFALVIGVRRARASRRTAKWLIVYMLFVAIYVLAVSAFLEKSEGAVYRQQIDAFLWTFLALAMTPATALDDVRD